MTLLLVLAGMLIGAIGWPLQNRDKRIGDVLMLIAATLLVAAFVTVVIRVVS